MIIGFLRCFLYALAGIPVTFAGFFVVAIAIPFSTVHEGSRPFTQYPERGVWRLVTLPSWAKWWSNEFDGAWGDKRGWWSNYCKEHYNKGHNAFYSMWKWLAVRNPANWWSRVVTGIDVSQCVIEKVAGQDVVSDSVGKTGWQILRALRSDGKCFPRLYVVLPWWFDPTHAVMIDIGWKIKLSHNGTPPDADPSDRLKGSVFTPSLWKGL